MRHESFQLMFFGIPFPRRASARELIERVAVWHSIDRETIVGRSKRDLVVEARFDAIAAVQLTHPHLSLSAIGRIFGGRDHSTIWNALRKRGVARRLELWRPHIGADPDDRD